MAKKGKNKGAASKPLKMAKTADRYQLYLQSVQAPDVDAAFFAKVYKKEFGHGAKILREDFCGTFAVCCEWVKRGDDMVAYGVDLDPEPLAWGAAHNLLPLRPDEKVRVHRLEADVRSADTPKVDILAAQNFSYCIFKTRAELLRYFKVAYEAMAPKGVFVLDLFGGYESIEDDKEEVTEHDGFDYVWEQHKYDPINAFGIYKIHFRFPDGSQMKDAFVYDWRLWTIPEVREVLQEVGFGRVDVYWEGTDPKTGEGSGRYAKALSADCDPAWTCYIVGVKGG
jgi:SAM-dependent methyltransferase